MSSETAVGSHGDTAVLKGNAPLSGTGDRRALSSVLRIKGKVGGGERQMRVGVIAV